jgi:hypothetical protein
LHGELHYPGASYAEPVTPLQKVDAFVSVNLYGSLATLEVIDTIAHFQKSLAAKRAFTLLLKARMAYPGKDDP